MPKVYQTTNPNLWIGKPRTAQFTVPLSAGVKFGSSEQSQGSPFQLSKGRLRLLGAQVTNHAAASAAGFSILMPDAMVAIGTWTDSTNTYADTTATAQGSGADIFTVVPNGGTAGNNNGFIVGCAVPFNVLSYEITTVAGGAPVFEFAYWGYPVTGNTAAGATWQVVSTNLIVLSPTAAAGEQLGVLNIPPDVMVKTAAGDFTGAPGGYYWIRVRSTTAATPTAGKSAHIYAGVELARDTSLAQDAQFNLAGGTGGFSRTIEGVGLQGFFGTTNVSNHVYVEYE